jgi:hypothetical protein
MLQGKTLDCLAIANTAILMRLLGELVDSDMISRPRAKALLRDAVVSLESCPEADRSNIVEAVVLIRKELMPLLS